MKEYPLDVTYCVGFEDALFNIGDTVEVRHNIYHDKPLWGKVGWVKKHIRLDTIDYYVSFTGGNICRFHYFELIKR